MLGRIVDQQLQTFVVEQGGLSNLLHRSARPGLSAGEIGIDIWGADEFGAQLGYRAVVRPGPGDQGLITEYLRSRSPERELEQVGPTTRESLVTAGVDHPVFPPEIRSAMTAVLTGCRVFHFHDTSSDAPVKRRTDEADNLSLAPDAANLAPLLARLQNEVPETYQRIVRTVRSVAPFFGSFVLKAESGRMRLRWQEEGLDGVFSADALSDGTLRFICLTTLLLQPDPPSTIVLDEPELGLHPFAIDLLGSLIRNAAVEDRKIIVATQSVTLLSHFRPEEIVVIERGEQGTSAQHLDVQDLDDWLADYSLGELWEKNVLGGRPRSSRTNPPAPI
ncbi:AAA family ATPase [Kineosporia babensis]|uniref:AAA family ATPase n=2 Tax=Kineosporia babensis TaxID=499548 RepID=A0A9X1SV89_9ACTN|nr:AAA family ATPase [Kineosporia babensis]